MSDTTPPQDNNNPAEADPFAGLVEPPSHIETVTVWESAGRVRQWVHHVTWEVAGQVWEKPCLTLLELNEYVAELCRVIRECRQFDPETGLPVGVPATSETFFEWAIDWFAKVSPRLTDQSKRRLRRSLTHAVLLAINVTAAMPPAGVRRHIEGRLGVIGAEPPATFDVDSEDWLWCWSHPLATLDALAVQRLYLGLGRSFNDEPYSDQTAAANRREIRRCYEAAVAEGKAPGSLWPSS